MAAMPEEISREREHYAIRYPSRFTAAQLREGAEMLEACAEAEAGREDLDLTRLYALHHAAADLRRAAYWRN